MVHESRLRNRSRDIGMQVSMIEHDLIVATIASGDVEAIDPMPMSSEEFGKYIRAEVVRWTALAKDRKIQIEE